MRILVVDIGGTHVKILATGQAERREFESGPTLTARQLVAGVERLANGWSYDLVSIGYPGLVLKGRIAAEPHNLAPGWVGFDFARAFGKPAQVVNDAAMHPDEIVVGGGNAKKLKELPPGCRLGDNSNAFIGGFRLWERAQAKARRH